MQHTIEQYNTVITACRDIFSKKLIDYGSAWRILRLTSVTDQLLIKASRIRNLEINTVHKISEGIKEELTGLVNYSVIGLIQFELGHSDKADISADEALMHYDRIINKARNLMQDKNHDYGEIWRKMRVSSYTDLILMKLQRVKQIEDNLGDTLISEGVDSNYYDIINYAVFGLIKISLE